MKTHTLIPQNKIPKFSCCFLAGIFNSTWGRWGQSGWNVIAEISCPALVIKTHFCSAHLMMPTSTREMPVSLWASEFVGPWVRERGMKCGSLSEEFQKPWLEMWQSVWNRGSPRFMKTSLKEARILLQRVGAGVWEPTELWGTLRHLCSCSFPAERGGGAVVIENLSCRVGELSPGSGAREGGGFPSVHALTCCALPSFCPDRGRGLPWWHCRSWACSPVSSQQSRAFCSFHFGES